MYNVLLKAALGYIDNGFHIFPLAPNSKVPLTLNGFKDASDSPEQIKAWWTEHPNANIGIATGKISNLLVLDIDGSYPEDWPDLPPTTKVKTNKGYHLYFTYPNGEEISCRTNINGLKIDVRSDGGYIVAPPSVHPNGGHYEFITE